MHLPFNIFDRLPLNNFKIKRIFVVVVALEGAPLFILHNLLRQSITITGIFGIYSIFDKNYDMIRMDNTQLLPMYHIQTIKMISSDGRKLSVKIG